MANLGRKMSIVSRSLRPQLIIAFCLMSVIPILALLNFIFPSFFPRGPFPLVIFAVVMMAILGFMLIKKIIDQIIEISSEAKVIANGELSHKIKTTREDEIGELSTALNQLTVHIKDNMDELKIYGERTKDINLQINKQMIVLSGLLQISNLIAKNAPLDDVFEITISKLAQVASSSLAFIILKKDSGFEIIKHYGLKADALASMKLPANAYLLNGLFAHKSFFKADSKSLAGADEEILKILSVKNLLVHPFIVQGKPAGLVGMGNQLDNFRYNDDDAELLSIFAKQLGIALENDFLSHKVQDLEIKDTLTGLYNRRYILSRLDEEILRAISQQRPCAFVVIKMMNLKELQLRLGDLAAEGVLIKVAAQLKSCVSEIDRVARLEGDEFAILVPEKNKKEAQVMASVIKDRVQQAFAGEAHEKKPVIRLSVVENPIDGMDSASLISVAKEALQ